MRKFLSKLSQAISLPSETSGTSQPTPELSEIAEHAERVEESTTTVADRIASLQEEIEYLREEVGQENLYRTELSEYVKDLRAEARFIANARRTIGTISVVMAIALFAAPIWLSVHAYPWFETLAPYPKSALMVGMLAAGVALMLTITRSVYRSAHERQTDEFIPPQIKMIHDMSKGS